MKAPPATAVRVAVTLGVAALALVAAWLLFLRYETRPWTRDGQVRANIVGVAPRVEGPVIRIPVRDNQRVNKGDLLFEIDPATFEAALANARARLEQSLAGVVQTKQELDRQTDLYTKQVNSLRDLQDAQDSYAAAQANADAAKAEVQTAKLNLEYTKVFAPVNGYLTNVQTSPGTYVYAGAQLLALVDADSFWVAAYFKETQLRHIQEGGPVDTGAASPDLLPAVPQTVDWVRLPQRFPVRVHVTGKPPVPLRIGQTVSVAVAAPGD